MWIEINKNLFSANGLFFFFYKFAGKLVSRGGWPCVTWRKYRGMGEERCWYWERLGLNFLIGGLTYCMKHRLSWWAKSYSDTFELLTYSMQHSSWEANRLSAMSRNFPPFMEPEGSLLSLQDPATCPYPGPDQSSPWPPSNFLKIHLNIILPSMPGSSRWSLSLRFPQQDTIYAYPPHMCYMSHPSHYSRFDHQNKIWWVVQISKLLIM